MSALGERFPVVQRSYIAGFEKDEMVIDLSCWLWTCKTDISFLGPVGCALQDVTSSGLILVERHSYQPVIPRARFSGSRVGNLRLAVPLSVIKYPAGPLQGNVETL
jgi:hypothetical protein